MASSDVTMASSPLRTQETGNRRKSGRAIRKPHLFADEHHEGSLLSNDSAKRKRVTDGEGDTFVNEDGSDVEDEISAGESAGSPDEEEELKGKKKQSRGKGKATKATAKRPRITNGTGATLAIRSANVPSKQAPHKLKVQNARSRPSQINQEGLYAEVFGHGQTGNDAAAGWFQRYERNNIIAMQELVNFVLQCTGCKAQVTVHDIEDVDNVTHKLGDLQEEYQEASIVDYPLISKQKDYIAFRPVLVDFFTAMIRILHNSSTLYDDTTLYENIQTWVDTMSSAGIRPFRHTATLISLTISTALCQVAKDLETSASLSRRQAETESKKKKVNQARVKSIQEKIELDEKKLERVENILRDEFDLVFVHRYRDVDPKIRVECVSAMGNWILTYRKMFLEGQYLRYLGWVLSDSVATTRGEVVKQLKLMFRSPNNIGPLRAFTERFRVRMVEIAGRDAEAGVRADAIDLLDRLREAELLEPDDIDNIGQLIYDSEPRVRKAVAKFFVSNLEDLYKVNTDAIENDQLDSVLPEGYSGDDYLSPTRSWIKFKCLAQTLSAYDGNEEATSGRRPALLVAANMDSRYMLATQAVFPHMPELQEWESLAGYLLFDHSSITGSPDDPDPGDAVQGIYKLIDGEEAILLEVLDYAVKLYLMKIADAQLEGKKKGGRKSRASKDDVQEKQEIAAHHLTLIIPQLLNKYGSEPQAASAILRLEQLLDMDLINELQQSETTYSALLEDINKQFMTHSDRSVLAEASVALLKAKSSEPAKEAADTKIQEMWDDAIGTLPKLLRGQNLEARGTLRSNTLAEVSNTVSRLSNLASISDCIAIFESALPTSISTPAQKGRKSGGSRNPSLTLLDLLKEICKRGRFDPDVDKDVAGLEDELATSVIRTLLFYFMWLIREFLASAQSANDNSSNNNKTNKTPQKVADETSHLVSRCIHRDAFTASLMENVSSRFPLDALRIHSLSTILDLYTLFSTLRRVKPTPSGGGSGSGSGSESVSRDFNDTILASIPPAAQTAILQTHDRLERSFAKKSRRKLEPTLSHRHHLPSSSSHRHLEPAETDLPIDSSESESESVSSTATSDDHDHDHDHVHDNDGDESLSHNHGRDARKAAVLLAEQRLCEFTGKIVLAVVGGVVDSKRWQERLVRNKLRLGANYKEVLAYLEEPAEKGAKGKKGGGAMRKKGVVGGSGNAVAAGTEATAEVGKDRQAVTSGSASGVGRMEKSKEKNKNENKSESMVVEEDDIEDAVEQTGGDEEGEEEEGEGGEEQDEDANDGQDPRNGAGGQRALGASPGDEADDNDDEDIMGD